MKRITHCLDIFTPWFRFCFVIKNTYCILRSHWERQINKIYSFAKIIDKINKQDLYDKVNIKYFCSALSYCDLNSFSVRLEDMERASP